MGDYRQEARLYRDGNMWCAVPPGFRDLAVDDAGFGETQELAVEDLRRRIAADLTVEDFVTGGYCRRCTEWVAEDEDMEGCRDPNCPWR